MTETQNSDGSDPQTGTQRLTVPPEARGMRVDQFLPTVITNHSRAYFQRLIRNGCITLNGHACRRASSLGAGDTIEITYPDVTPAELQPEDIAFDILHEDDSILVINKPPGLVVHPAEGNLTGTLVHGLLFHDQARFTDMTDETLRPGIVHRLDKDTSGAMVVAKTMDARRALKDAFKERLVEKTYLTIVLGEFGVVTGRIENSIGRNPWNRQKMAVVAEGGKHALTTYRVLATAHGCSFLEVRIFTGRTHQIRVHFSDLNHPVLGDAVYGGLRSDACVRPARQMLHAWKLVLPHPDTGVMRQYMAPPPDDFQETLEALNLPRVGARGPDD